MLICVRLEKKYPYTSLLLYRHGNVVIKINKFLLICAIWRCVSGSTFADIMGCCLTSLTQLPKATESFYQCDPLLLQSVNIYLNILNINPQTVLKIYTFGTAATSPRGKRVKSHRISCGIVLGSH